jgi:CRISPR-associated protein Cas1
MNLVLTTFGTYLHRNGEMFVVKVKEEKNEISSRKVRSIFITTGASLSTDAIQLAIERNIDIVFLDKYGHPYGRVWHGKLGSTTAIRRQQLRFADTDEGVELAKSWIIQKLDNQINYLTSARQKRTRLSAVLTDKIEALETLKTKIANLSGELDEIRGSLMGLEGKAGAIYWQAVNVLLPERYQFKERSRNPAQDEFNCLINYAYGVLYSTVERASILAGLDPYVGFIHTDHYNKKSFVFDIIEMYRIWADETVIGLFAARKVTQALFDKLHNGFMLNKEGKAVLMDRFEHFLDEKIRYGHRQVQRRETVQLYCHNLANQLLEKSNETQ